MKYISEFRDGDLAQKIVDSIHKESPSGRIMEFCGGHTITLVKYGIPEMLPPSLEMVSGPGCPVCVTSRAEIDSAIDLALNHNVILASFGDMIRVPGNEKSLRDCMGLGAEIKVVYSPNDAVKLAQENKDRKVVFFAVGFETTAPVTAATIKLAKIQNLKNFFILSAHKTTPGILKALLDGKLDLDAFVCPGHVTAITGTSIYSELTKAGKPCVVSGFEPLDILQSVLMIVRQLKKKQAKTEIEYSRVAREEGNVTAQKIMREIFRPVDAVWRGLGNVPGSGLKPHEKYECFDAEKKFGIKITIDEKEAPNCICGEILRGLKKPTDCKLFKKACDPDNPVGACMVSDEGTCSVYYRFKTG